MDHRSGGSRRDCTSVLPRKTDCIISIIRYNTRDRIGREDICYGYTSAAFATQILGYTAIAITHNLILGRDRGKF